LWSNKKKEIEQLSKDSGITMEVPPLSFKNHGMKLKLFAVGEQIAKGQYENLEKDKKYKIEIELPPIPHMYKINRMYKDFVRGGLTFPNGLKAKVNKKYHTLNIGSLLPETDAIMDWNYTKKKLSEITAEESPDFYELQGKHNMREAAKESVIKAWEKMNEGEAYKFLLQFFARKLLLLKYLPEGPFYQIPEKGMLFTAKVKQPYNKIVTAEWDGEMGGWDVIGEEISYESVWQEWADWKPTNKDTGEVIEDTVVEEEGEEEVPW
jgi:hypothetical protein